jgi:hypothetical protein
MHAVSVSCEKRGQGGCGVPLRGSGSWWRAGRRLIAIIVLAATTASVGAGSANALLSPVLLAVTVSPLTASVAAGDAQQYTATGHYSDLSTADLTDSVTWSSSSTTTATVSNAPGSQGLVTGVGTGAATITATDSSSSLAGVATVTVTGTPPVPSLKVTPSSGRRRTTIEADGTGFSPGGTVTVTYKSGVKGHGRSHKVLCTATVANDGTFSCSGKIPRRDRSGKRGQHSVMASEPDGTEATTTFTLT